MDDFDAIIELADECFPGDRDSGGMLARWPHCYIREPERMRNYLIMKDGPKVISMVGYIDQAVLVEGDEVKVAGITGVATTLNYRRQGLMTKLLNDCIIKMGEEGYAFSDLGGDRIRYGRFGWESAGRQWWFDVTRRSILTAATPTGYEVVQYPTSPEEVEGTFALHMKETTGVKRTRALHEIILGRKGKQVWLARDSKGVGAYVVVDSDERWQAIVEYSGSAEGVHAILMHLVKVLGSEFLHVISPWSHPLNKMFFAISARWGVSPTRMLKIIDLNATLSGFTNQLANRYRVLGLQGKRAIVLSVEETGQKARIVFSPDGVEVGDAADTQRAFTLPERRMVRLLFGPGMQRLEFNLPSNARFLEGLLPLDFHIWENEAV